MDQKGIKETLEVLAGVEVLVLTGKQVFADGKVTFEDAKHLTTLVKEHQVLIESVKGANEIVPEMKDLSTEELAIVGARVIEMIKKYKAA